MPEHSGISGLENRGSYTFTSSTLNGNGGLLRFTLSILRYLPQPKPKASVNKGGYEYNLCFTVLIKLQ